jgi:hypothetical protein
MSDTHERNVLMWLVTRGWFRIFIWITFVIGCGFLLLGGCNKITSSTEVGHPNEEAIKMYAQCYYNYAELEPKMGKLQVVFEDKARPVSCPEGTPPGDDGMCHTAGWAMPGTNTIHFVRPWVRSPERTMWDLEWTAAHEVAHLKGIWLHDYELDLGDGRLTVDAWAWAATQAMKERGGCGNQV